MEDLYTDSDGSYSTFSSRTSLGETFPALIDDLDFKNIISNNLENIYRELIYKGDYGEVWKFIWTNKECNALNTRELNEDKPADGHKFIERDGKMQFITPKCSLQWKSSNETSSQEECKCSSKESQMFDAINIYSHLLNQIISYLSIKFSDFDVDFRTDFK